MPEQQPAEHCGHQPSEAFTWRHPGQYGECVLRPGHQGSHADQHGMRWWLHTEEHQGSPKVQGRCPACGNDRLFLGSEGYVTCPRIDCPEPDAASTLLEQSRGTTSITIEPNPPDFTVTKNAQWAPACAEGRHSPPHPGDTCDEVDAFIVAARDQRIASALADAWLHGNGAGAALGLLPTIGNPPEPTPEQRALNILRPHLAAEPLYRKA